MSVQRILAAAASCAMLTNPAVAAVTAEDAKLLGTSLTLFGAEKAGNAEGSIPAYTAEGAKITPPPTADLEKGFFPNPFTADKPLFTITASNVERYKSKLDEGTLAMLARWSDTFRVQVYPTRRTAPYPDWVLKNTVANATSARLVNDRGDGVTGAYGGIPFPIPKVGVEVLWNHLLSWTPQAVEGRSPGFMVDSSGSLTYLSTADTYYERNYYSQTGSTLDGPYFKLLAETVAPPRSAGEKNLRHYSIDFSKQPDLTWAYSPGQRRVRLAPEFAYDTPAAPYGGALFYDEIFGFAGRPDRFDWKLVGKREMYIPYNSYDLINSNPKDLFGKTHLSSEKTRWELHRVWEVRATLRSDSRHVVKERFFYFDEDSWRIVLSSGYDQAGKIYRIGQQHCAQLYDKVVEYHFCSFVFYDLIKGQYVITPVFGADGFQRVVPVRSPAATTPSSMAGSGIR